MPFSMKKFLFHHPVMLRYEASSSICIADLPVEEDPSLSLRMTR
jgi:hypothetical protein